MARKTRTLPKGWQREPLVDVLGGVWLVTLLLSLMHLPALVA